MTQDRKFPEFTKSRITSWNSGYLIMRRYLRKGSVSLLFACSLAAGTFSCDKAPVTESLRIELRWIPAYKGENRVKIRTGILWSLSLLGARLDTSSNDSLMIWRDSLRFTLNLEKAGFDPRAEDALRVILKKMRVSGEYIQNGTLDLGRFLVLTEHSSWHYYRITGVPNTLQEFRKLHPMDSCNEFRLQRSCVTKNARTIIFGKQGSWKDVAFIAMEHESRDEESPVVAYEAFDVMANGQLRFCVYDRNGKLLVGSPGKNGPGKPSKCNWCHESIVQPLFFETTLSSRGIDTSEFMDAVAHAQQLIDTYRDSLRSLINYSNKHDHEYGELLYTGFMEPTLMRVMNEWGMDSVNVMMKLNAIPVHTDREYRLFPEQWYRRHVDSLIFYEVLQPPSSVRDVCGDEPDYFR